MKKYLQKLQQQITTIPIVIRYGTLLALALVCIKTLEYQVFSFRLNQQLYIGIIASFFLFLGVAATYLWRRFNDSHVITNNTVPILTIKELKLLQGLAQGLTNQQLADATFLSVNTIKTQLKSLYRKLLVKNRSEAVAKAKNLNLLEL
ncbi:LuxR C-terminal-related transcriptional regulator [uncultured Paraglaciecola sp.]|uniref:helix-turn-helix transcriptional regulator n=1 Tax=uncultured Paraglaciecola sp. TaxID=1765024 RepID=UPI0030DDB254|tara:strand:- start:11947 stop:12390 length:444 start_codon:yes stop_codon:yes gene_type:complete